ncbi:hypothetical protein ES705_39541 [subsurface metagenome]
MEKPTIDKRRVPFKIISAKTLLIITSCILIVSTTTISASVADTTQWRQLFNGKDLTGWKHAGQGSMSVEDGLIRGHGGMGLLYWAGEKFGNCTIRVVFKMRDTNSNSTDVVYFREIAVKPLNKSSK